ncbi:unnamed protein product [Camellia sinensis]
MDRQAHDYAAAMAFVQQQQQQQQQTTNIQQQQQFGFHQQFPPSVHGPPFLPPQLSLQQYPFPRHMQQPHQLHPHPPPYPHLFHLQQQQQPPLVFPPHMPPHLVPSPFIGPYDSPPHPAAPPSDPELQKRIDKLVEYAAKNGPEFEAMIREKQQDNLDYSFLFGGEGHNYYWSFKGLSGPPPSDVAMEMNNVLNNLNGTKEPRFGLCRGLLLHQLWPRQLGTGCLVWMILRDNCI